MNFNTCLQLKNDYAESAYNSSSISILFASDDPNNVARRHLKGFLKQVFKELEKQFLKDHFEEVTFNKTQL